MTQSLLLPHHSKESQPNFLLANLYSTKSYLLFYPTSPNQHKNHMDWINPHIIIHCMIQSRYWTLLILAFHLKQEYLIILLITLFYFNYSDDFISYKFYYFIPKLFHTIFLFHKFINTHIQPYSPTYIIHLSNPHLAIFIPIHYKFNCFTWYIKPISTTFFLVIC